MTNVCRRCIHYESLQAYEIKGEYHYKLDKRSNQVSYINPLVHTRRDNMEHNGNRNCEARAIKDRDNMTKANDDYLANNHVGHANRVSRYPSHRVCAGQQGYPHPRKVRARLLEVTRRRTCRTR